LRQQIQADRGGETTEPDGEDCKAGLWCIASSLAKSPPPRN
jgi:hypothetical protein